MKRMIVGSTDDIITRFEVGKTYRTSMLHGGTEFYKVISRTADAVRFQISHISEDDGSLIIDSSPIYDIVLADQLDENFDVIGKQEAVAIWEYRGHVGYLYSAE